MDKLKNALLAPFSATAAAQTTPATTAIVYGLAGLLAGALLSSGPA